MPCDSRRHHRRSVRLRGYDYAQAGAYFVTVCVHGRQCLFGAVADGGMNPNTHGRIVAEWWDALPGRFPNVDLDASVVMPNHFHGILVFSEPSRGPGGTCTARGGVTPPLPTDAALGALVRPTLGQVVAYFKYQSAKTINHARGTPGDRLWQRSFYDHVIRDEKSLDRLRNYVATNPLRWELDQLHPDRASQW